MDHQKAVSPGIFLSRQGWWVCIAAVMLTVLLAALLLPAGRSINSQASPVLSVAGTALGTYPGQETTYHIELLNHTDQIVYDGVISLTLPSGFSYVPDSTIALGEGWPLESREPLTRGQTLTWGPYNLPAAGNKAHNPYGIHTMMHDCGTLALHLEGAKSLAGNGGYVTQLFYGLDARTTGPSQCAINFVSEAYARNLIPILRLEGHFVNGIWQAPDPGPDGDYSEVAQGFASFVAGLPRRDTNPLYLQIWNEPDLWIEWSGSPNARQYARFFVAVARAIRQLGDGRIRLVNGALTPGNPAFIEQMLQVRGFRDAFDAWSSHCYPYNHPAWYNNHRGTARYGTYTIDCYLEELAVLRRYGRADAKVILTESGYELGSNVYGFEGFPAINETNRASYIGSAFADYWKTWPEVIAVTPFQLSDSSGHWDKFDWLYPSSPYPPHRQYEVVAAQAKPDGGLEPYGYQIIFKVKVDPAVAPGLYPSHLAGRDREGHYVLEPEAVPVQIYAPDTRQLIYLPLVAASPPRDGPWYLSNPAAASTGAIMPTGFLKPVAPELGALAVMTETAAVDLAGEPVGLALAEQFGLGAVLLADGQLETIELATLQSTGTFLIGPKPQAIIAAATSASARAYISLEDEIVLVDLPTKQIVNRWSEAGRWRGLAWDRATGRLFAVDADNERLLLLGDDLAQALVEIPLDDQPDQLLLDPTSRHLYLSFPAVPRLMALNADSLAITGQAALTGGPILDLTLDRERGRLYALSALAPGYRAISAWAGPALPRLALIAGAVDFPLQTASALAVAPDGHLLLPELTGLWQVSPGEFSVTNIGPTRDLKRVTGLAADRQSVYLLERSAQRLRVYR